MSEVKRYHVTETGLVEGESLGRLSVVLAADFDRVTAERDAALAELGRYQSLFNQAQKAIDRLNELHRKRMAEIGQRLTAADERADVLGLDAARYRWLRDPDNQEDLEPDSDYLMPPIICGYAEHEDILSMEALDKAIDSAMSEAPKP